ncbi:MAG TPA: hypothetical protein VFM51_01815 [Solirubrobacterales bacterium]|nr:hypothetical protein [Solirubrobacterales bacterium]
MDVDRLSTGEKIAGVSAVLLFIFMFFDWFSVDVSASDGLVGGSFTAGNAWDWFTLIDIFLLITVVVAVAVVVVRISDAVFEPPVSMNAIVAVLGGIAVLLILYRIIDPPEGGDLGGLSVDINPAAGAILGLLAAAGVTFGGYRAMQEEGTSFADVGDQLSSGGRGPGGTQPPSQSPPPPPPPPPPAGGGAPPAQ